MLYEREKSCIPWVIATCHCRSAANAFVVNTGFGYHSQEWHRIPKYYRFFAVDGDDIDAAISARRWQGQLYGSGYFLHGEQAYGVSRFHGVHQLVEAGAGSLELDGVFAT